MNTVTYVNSIYSFCETTVHVVRVGHLCRKTEGVDYQNYSQDALQQLQAKLKRKRHRPHLVYDEPGLVLDRGVLQGMLGANASVSIADMTM